MVSTAVMAANGMSAARTSTPSATGTATARMPTAVRLWMTVRIPPVAGWVRSRLHTITVVVLRSIAAVLLVAPVLLLIAMELLIAMVLLSSARSKRRY